MRHVAEMHTRYRVHDTQRVVASSLRRNTAINPRYSIVDKSTGETVDAFTTRDTAQYICTSMNVEHRLVSARAAAIVDESGTSLSDAFERATYEHAHNLIPR
jgi:hypothetical protein